MDEMIIAKGTFKKSTGLGITLMVIGCICFIIAFASIITILPAVIFATVGFVVYWRGWVLLGASKQEVTVYSDHVTLRTIKRFTTNIDLKDITAVEKIGKKTIRVRTGSTMIIIFVLENSNEIVDTIYELRSQFRCVTNAESENVALELKTYQKLLEEGAITQEDYDAKKKEILKL